MCFCVALRVIYEATAQQTVKKRKMKIPRAIGRSSEGDDNEKATQGQHESASRAVPCRL
jgi:hypothetical protein